MGVCAWLLPCVRPRVLAPSLCCLASDVGEKLRPYLCCVVCSRAGGEGGCELGCCSAVLLLLRCVPVLLLQRAHHPQQDAALPPPSLAAPDARLAASSACAARYHGWVGG